MDKHDSGHPNSVAIIGMAGRFPGACNIWKFWENIVNGVESVTFFSEEELISAGADPERVRHPDYVKAAAFLEKADCFDAGLFGYTPREAVSTDPAHRLFLECAWEALEDAGYGGNFRGERIGVFGGSGPVVTSYMVSNTNINPELAGQVGSIEHVGNDKDYLCTKVSYKLNLKGPSLTIQTACSTSLVAVHMACQSLLSGECDMALAGGVNIRMPQKDGYIIRDSPMHSPDGHCRPFDADAKGTIFGSGLGIVLLKPLDQATEDRDPVHAVIRGSAISNDGSSKLSYWASSADGLSDTLSEALAIAEVEPDTIGYVEAHGTGTELGDPVEVIALTRVFRQSTSKKQFCALGSVKSNIGHTDSASGIAGLIKTVMMLRHKMLAPTLHVSRPNPKCKFDKSPFFVSNTQSEWKNDHEKRRAVVNSMGIGGTNACVVLEESSFLPVEPDRQDNALESKEPRLIVLSAKNEDRLKAYARKLAEFLEPYAGSNECSLSSVAFTLQTGREAMQERLAVLASDTGELREKLTLYYKDEPGIPGLYAGTVKGQNKAAELLISGNSGEQIVGIITGNRELDKLAQLWVLGLEIDWRLLYPEDTPNRISLPTYPFSRDRYRISESRQASDIRRQESLSMIHPLVHKNTSDFSVHQFSSTFTGKEFFLADYVVNGRPILPGVVCLEMARAAVEQAAGVSKQDGTARIILKNIVWSQPLAVEELLQLHIRLFPEESGEIAYEIFSEIGEKEPVIHNQGKAVLSPVAEVPRLDIGALQAECSQNCLSSEQCYDIFKKTGIDYGPGYRRIEKLCVGSGRAIAKLVLPCSDADVSDHFVLHPGLTDSALQASLGLTADNSTASSWPGLPFALEQLEIFGRCNSDIWASVTYGYGTSADDNIRKSDIDVCDEQGNICVRMMGFTSRPLEGEACYIHNLGIPQLINAPSEASPAVSGTLIFEPVWKEQAVDREAVFPDYARHLIILCESNEILQKNIEIQMNGSACLALQSKEKEIPERFQTCAVKVFEEIQRIIKEKPETGVLIQVVVSAEKEYQLFAGFSGLLKTARLENPKLICQLIEMEPGDSSELIVKRLKENRLSPKDQHIRYQNTVRQVFALNESEVSQETDIPWKDRGVYLITGGAGGLGLIFAGEIAGKVKEPVIILTGRSQLTDFQINNFTAFSEHRGIIYTPSTLTPCEINYPEICSKEKKLQFGDLKVSGARIEYRQADVTRKEETDNLIRGIRENFGNLDGIIHSAGVIRDSFILKKTKDEFREVLAPKVTGLVNLDESCRDIALDFFILFSSVAGITGNTAQSDYACANAFMDAYAEYRNKLVAKKLRHGKTLSVNWPLWKEGGMRVHEQTGKMMRQQTGIVPMNTSSGICAFYKGLMSGSDRVIVAEGDIRMIRKHFLETETETVSDIRLSQSELPVPHTDWAYPQVGGVPEYPSCPRSHAPRGNAGCSAPRGYPHGETCLANLRPPTCGYAYTDSERLREKTLHCLKLLFAETIGSDSEIIDAEEPLESYGINSVIIMQLNQKLSDVFDELSKTLFYEYQTLETLTNYLIADHPRRCTDWTGLKDQNIPVPEKNLPVSDSDSGFPVLTPFKPGKTRVSYAGFQAYEKNFQEPIAIIGMSGRYPHAETLEELWENLKTGRNCITEIPEDRWPIEGFFHPDPQDAAAQGKSYSKWGGFLEGFADFDPLFFNISPREAMNTDPQERLFVQSCWEVLEDAGYTKAALSARFRGQIGIFAGITKTGFDLYGPDLRRQGEQISPRTSFSSVANRVSYLLDLQGPSMSIDTMCSASLTAVHEACEHLRRDECEIAIAGGVNLYLHPQNYIDLCSQQMLSPDGLCRSFGKNGNGFAPGEGVGVILLRPLSDAVKDRDNIYGVILGTCINHGGKTNGYTVPNPTAQGELVRKALDRSDIDARTLSYIEAHGTGTKLGDPIEITGLTHAFQKDTGDTGFCAVGSVKSNIGHLEAAAGIAGIAKILLQMKNHKLAPSLHAEELNPNIDFTKTPFTVQQELAEWKRPVINGSEIPRRAGISSFGAGGSNAHVVIEEYQEESGADYEIRTREQCIIVLSAKNKERLKAYAEKTANFLNSAVIGQKPAFRLADMAYTLQVGREAMEERLAVIADTFEELEEKLTDFAKGRKNIEDLYQGQVRQNKDMLTVFAADEDMEKITHAWIAKKRYSKLADLWVKGLVFDWTRLYSDIKPRRISLPTYPFARECYWIPKFNVQLSDINGAYPQVGGLTENPPCPRSHAPRGNAGCIAPRGYPQGEICPANLSPPTHGCAHINVQFCPRSHAPRGNAGCSAPRGYPQGEICPANLSPPTHGCAHINVQFSHLHPLLHKNTSDFSEQRFSSVFTGDEFFLADHVVKGTRILPGVVYLEMARAAVEQAAGVSEEKGIRIRLRNVVWIQPLAVNDDPVHVHISLLPDESGEINYEIYSGPEDDEGTPVIHTRGSATLIPVSEVSPVDIETLQAECGQKILSSEQYYDAFKQMGIYYGPGHRGIETLYMGSDQTLAKLSLPSSDRDRFVLHPGLTDSALQASVSLMTDHGAAPSEPALPFALEQLDIFGRCTPGMWAVVRYGGGASAGDRIVKFDIDMCDEQGNICVRMKGFSARPLKDEAGSSVSGTLMLTPSWEEERVGSEAAAHDYARHLVILCGSDETFRKNIGANLDGAICLAVQLGEKEISERFQTCAVRVFEEIRRIIAEKPGSVLIQVVIPVEKEQRLFAGLSGLLKTAQLENPKLICQLIETEPGDDPGTIAGILKENSLSPGDQHIRYKDGRRFVFRLTQAEISEDAEIPWKDRGVYLITGGAGGLGFVFAGDIAAKVRESVIIMTGRSLPDSEMQTRIKKLESSGARIEYRQADVTRKEETENLIRDIRENFGTIHGIIHSAGLIRDSFILKKTGDEFREVLAPKVTGLVNLDEASRETALDFLILFSSSAGVVGNAGQSDYACANAFMDAYAEYRNGLVSEKKRHGRTLSMNWPMWKEGGMRIDEESEKMMRQLTGTVPMSTQTGISALYRGLASGKSQVMVAEGSLSQMRRKLLSAPVSALRQSETSSHVMTTDTDSLLDNLQTVLIRTVSELLMVMNEDIDIDAELSEYGFDSITLTEFANRLNEKYKLELIPTVFFEYPTLRNFAEYLIEEHRGAFASQTVTEPSVQTGAFLQTGEESFTQAPESFTPFRRPVSRFTQSPVQTVSGQGMNHFEPVAIVGMSGKFPMAEDVNEFWKNLAQGKDCIAEIPRERWDWREWYGDPTKEANKTNITRGGFISGVDEFDPLFFGISPREAELMDPQQRLLMIYVWKAVEDAGYSARTLSGTRTAIFAGTDASGYSEMLSRAGVAVEGYSSTGAVSSVGPNRMSYFLNIHGPSEPVETACSSSLIAMHRAATALESGACDMAVAGGVNTIVNPDLHISF
ncbi:MAG: SDR family NAD(P)-dependent oxidoreductase, partial [Desulfobacteraceae bacterium]|nr:SDR family NAD(P)-dependent oxidoreductase [Desulfobacteraceae bacterium]